jgi:ankyrin repeat protein
MTFSLNMKSAAPFPLHEATRKGDIAKALELLHAGVDVSAKNEKIGLLYTTQQYGTTLTLPNFLLKIKLISMQKIVWD